MALQEEQVEVTTKSVEEYIKELEKARDEKVLDKLNESIAKNVLELQKQLDTLNATSEAEKLSIKLGRDLDAKEMRIIRLIAKRKEELKKLAETERNREKFVTSLNKIQEENAQNQFAQGQTIIDLRNKEFDVFRGNEEAMATIKKTLNDKNLKLAELNQQKLIALGSVNLLDESMRAKAKEEIEENFQRKRRQIIADSDENKSNER